MIEIPLSKQGTKYKGMFVAIVDDEDAVLAEQDWRVLVSRETVYAARMIYEDKKPICFLLHRIILARKLDGELSTEELVDHIDGNGLNCTRKNLRKADHSKNAANRGKQSNNTSGYKGVSFEKRRNKYVAEITWRGKRHRLGSFDDPAIAHEAYCKKADELHESFANHGD